MRQWTKLRSDVPNYCIGAEDMYLTYRKEVFKRKNRVFYRLSETVYRRILSFLIDKMVEELCETGYLILPNDLGTLCVHTGDRIIPHYSKRGDLILPYVSWVKTKKLWKEDPSAADGGIVVRDENAIRLGVAWRPGRYPYSDYTVFHLSQDLFIRIYHLVYNEGKRYIKLDKTWRRRTQAYTPS